MRSAGLLLTALLLCGCDSMVTKPLRYNTIETSVTQRDGRPIADVPVVLYTGTRPIGYGTTSANGRYTFQFVPQGQYGIRALATSGLIDVQAVAGGYPSSVIDNLKLTHDSTVLIALTFLRRGSGSLSARVTDAAQRPMAKIPVDLYNPQHVEASAVTDSNGVVSFANVGFGNHGLRITRPRLYRDFNTPNDSLYAIRDGLVVDSGSTQTVAVPLARCAGTVVARIVDQNGAPVPVTTTVLYDSEERLGLGVSDAAGTIAFTDVPCAYFLAAVINPPAGYSVGEGRGLNFIDGFRVTNGVATTLTFTVQKN